MKFKILEGKHTQDGKTYSKDDVLESEARLDEIFVGKFQLVLEEPSPKSKSSVKQKAFSKKVVKEEPDLEPEEVIEEEEEEDYAEYVVKPNKIKGWFDVVDMNTGRKANDRKLRKSQAEKLCEELNA